MPEALDKAVETLGKGFAECRTRQRRLGKQCISKAFFAECFFSGTRQRGLPSARGHSAKKSNRYGDGVTETASLPSVCPAALGKESIFAECHLGHSAKSPPGRVPMSSSLLSAMCGTRQSVPLCRVPGLPHSAKKLYWCPGIGTLKLYDFMCSSPRFIHIVSHNFLETFSNFYHSLYI